MEESSKRRDDLKEDEERCLYQEIEGQVGKTELVPQVDLQIKEREGTERA